MAKATDFREKMAGVLAEIVRRKNRILLKEASSITIALDESNTRKVLRFCCDTPNPPYTAKGVIGTLRLSYEQKGEDAGGVQEQMEEDHAVHALRALKLCLIRFCTRPTRTKRPRRTATAKATARTTVTAAARGTGGRFKKRGSFLARALSQTPSQRALILVWGWGGTF